VLKPAVREVDWQLPTIVYVIQFNKVSQLVYNYINLKVQYYNHMSYIRMGHPLQWFNDCSTEYVFGRGEGVIEDYGTGFEHLPSLIEMVGRIVLIDTKDFNFATKVVVALACKSGIKHKLRMNKPHEFDDLEKMRGHDYLKEVNKWINILGTMDKLKNFHTDIDEIEDFEYLDVFTDEEELFDVGKNMDDIINEARADIQSIVDKLELPCAITIDASFFRWTGCDGDYEFGVDLRFDKVFTSDTKEEEREIDAVEKAIIDSGVLKSLENRVGKIEICCYVPFELSDIPPKG